MTHLIHLLLNSTGNRSSSSSTRASPHSPPSPKALPRPHSNSLSKGRGPVASRGPCPRTATCPQKETHSRITACLRMVCPHTGTGSSQTSSSCLLNAFDPRSVFFHRTATPPKIVCTPRTAYTPRTDSCRRITCTQKTATTLKTDSIHKTACTHKTASYPRILCSRRTSWWCRWSAAWWAASLAGFVAATSQYHAPSPTQMCSYPPRRLWIATRWAKCTHIPVLLTMAAAAGRREQEALGTPTL